MKTSANGSIWRLLCAALLIAAAQGSKEFPICTIPCCAVQPSCSDALHVTCECQDQSPIHLRRGDIPESVQGVIISGAPQVTMHENALRDLASLVTLDLHNIGSLELRPDGLALQENAKLFSLRIENVKDVEVFRSTFSGFWKHRTNIKMQAVEKLHIRQNGFTYQSTFGPNLIMERIRLLDLAPNALTAPIRELVMTFVNMTSCRGESFGENISHMEMNHVNIQQVNNGCIKGSGNLTKITIRSCNLEIIRPLGISGNIADVRVHDSNITTVRENGFMLQADRLQVTDSRILDLMSNGLNVRIKKSIYLNKVRIELLRKHALFGLQVTSNTAGYLPPIRMHNLAILHAENGSLSFAKRVSPSFHRLEVRPPEPPVCPTERWIRWLVEKDEDSMLTPAEHQIFHQLQRRWLCPEGDKATLIKTNNLNSKGGDAPETSHEAREDGSPQRDDEAASFRGAAGSVTHQEDDETDSFDEGTEGGSHQGSSETITPGGVADSDTSLGARDGDTSQGDSATYTLLQAVQEDTINENTETGTEARETDTSNGDGEPFLAKSLRLKHRSTHTHTPFRTGDGGNAKADERSSASHGDMGSMSSEPVSPPISTGLQSSSDELRDLKQQMIQVTRHLIRITGRVEEIEAENQRRTLREVILYTACASYFAIKMYLWMDRDDRDA